MSQRFSQIILLGIVAVGANVCVAPPAEAGPILDWLFGRRRASRYAADANPVTTVARPDFASAAAGGCCGPATCVQTVVRYAPQTAYRTDYVPIPVTTYKTSTSCNPQTGLPITCTRPCLSYRYQARRVPVTTYRAYYAQEPVTAPGGCCNTGVATTSYAAPSTSAIAGYTPGTANLGSCGAGCATGSSVLSGTQQSSTYGSNDGWTNIDPSQEIAPLEGGSTDPADLQPQIDLQELQRINPEVRRRADSITPGSSTRIRPLPGRRSQREHSSDSIVRQERSSVPRSTTSSNRFQSNLRLIPNPQKETRRSDIQGTRKLDDSVPSLLQQPELEPTRTAQRRRQRRTVPIVWARASSAKIDIVRPSTSRPKLGAPEFDNGLAEVPKLNRRWEAAKPAPAENTWDDSGWRAHRPNER